MWTGVSNQNSGDSDCCVVRDAESGWFLTLPLPPESPDVVEVYLWVMVQVCQDIEHGIQGVDWYQGYCSKVSHTFLLVHTPPNLSDTQATSTSRVQDLF